MNNAKFYLYTSENGEEKYSMISDCELTRLGDSVSMYISEPEGNFIIGISEGIITLTRTGEHNYTLVLEEGVTRPFAIKTQYGVINANLMPHRVIIKDHTDEIKVYLKYQICFADSAVVSNIVKIKCIINKEEK